MRYEIQFRNESSERINMVQQDAIFIKINKRFRENMSKEELYDESRGVWKVNENKVKNVKYAFAIYKGIIKEVYYIDEWHKAYSTPYYYRTNKTFQDDPSLKGRKEFTGKVALDIRDCFIEKSVAKYYKKGEANPIKYMNFEELYKDFCNEKFIYSE